MTRQGQLRWSQLKVGLLVIIAAVFSTLMIMNLEQGMGLFSRQTAFRAEVPHTQGLKVGGPVRMNGVDIGNVHNIMIAETSPKVEIAFTVKRRVAPHIHEDATVSIRPMGLLGDKFLDILPGSPDKPPMPPGGILKGSAEMDLTSLASGATVTFEQVNQAIREVQQLLTRINQGEGTASKLITDPALYDRSKEVLDNMAVASEKSIKLLDKVEKGEGTVGQLLSDKELYVRANRAVKDLSELAERLNDKNGTLAKLSDPTLYTRLDELTSRGELLLAKLENGEGTIGKLVTKDELYQRADKLLTEVEDFVTEIKTNPTKYFKFSVF
jgi:phospholipid/cholesterol/gamma-HCH transport system substrate-binding protein